MTSLCSSPAVSPIATNVTPGVSNVGVIRLRPMMAVCACVIRCENKVLSNYMT